VKKESPLRRFALNQGSARDISTAFMLIPTPEMVYIQAKAATDTSETTTIWRSRRSSRRNELSSAVIQLI